MDHVLPVIAGVLLGELAIRLIKSLKGKRKAPPSGTHRAPDTCAYCTHLYLNNDGSAACDSPYEKYCLQGSIRMFKEFKKMDGGKDDHQGINQRDPGCHENI